MASLSRCAISFSLALGACSFHSTATHWNRRIGVDGQTIFVKTTTNVGLNLLIIVPFLGNTTMDTMCDVTSLAIADQDGDRLRVIQATSENYWYGFPPFTWILTPVITDVAIEYRPSDKELAEYVKVEPKQAENASARGDGSAEQKH